MTDDNTKINLILEKILNLLKNISPVIVSINGKSGTGKSTLAFDISKRINSTIVPIDDFFQVIFQNTNGIIFNRRKIRKSIRLETY